MIISYKTMHWFLPSLLVLLEFQSVCGVVGYNFTEIKIIVASGKVEQLTVSTGNFEWMKNLQNHSSASPMLCSVYAYVLKCYCDENVGRCWDYNDVMNTIYMISRDKSSSSVPLSQEDHQGNSLRGLERIPLTLEALFASEEAGMELYYQKKIENKSTFNLHFTQFERAGSNGVRIWKNGIFKNVLISYEKNEIFKDKNQGDIGIRISGLRTGQIGSAHFEMYCGFGECPGGEEMRWILMRSKLLEIYDAQKMEHCYEPQNTTSYQCPMEEVRELVPAVFHQVLEASNGMDQKVNISMINSRFKIELGLPENQDQVQGVGGVIICCFLASIFFCSFLIVFNAAITCEPQIERKPLDHDNWIPDKEQILEDLYVRKLYNMEESSVSLEAACALEEARAEQRRKLLERQGVTFESTPMKTPVDSSALGSRMDSPEGAELELQATQGFSETQLANTQSDSLLAHTAPSSKLNTPPVEPEPVTAPVVPAVQPPTLPAPPAPQPPSVPPPPPSTPMSTASSSRPYDERSAELIGAEIYSTSNVYKEARTPIMKEK